MTGWRSSRERATASARRRRSRWPGAALGASPSASTPRPPRRTRTPSEPTAAAVPALGRRTLPLDADVGDVAAIDRMVGRVADAFGGIDVLVNNAGVTRRAYIMDLTEEDWERIMRVNGKGVFFCLQRVAREMIPRRR